MNKALFYILSYAWGFPMTLIGIGATIVLKIKGCKFQRHGWCHHYECGHNWGGVNFGPVFITAIGASEHTKNHEHGHALQNCIWGPLMPFVIAIPSALRYWVRRLRKDKNKELPAYDSIWFEGQASKWGNAFMKQLKEKSDGNN